MSFLILTVIYYIYMNAFKTLLITALIGLSIVTPSGARPSKEEKMKVNAVELYESVAPHLVNNKGGQLIRKRF